MFPSEFTLNSDLVTPARFLCCLERWANCTSRVAGSDKRPIALSRPFTTRIQWALKAGESWLATLTRVNNPMASGLFWNKLSSEIKARHEYKAYIVTH